jgi:tyrosyl-tRNA synthetase
MDDIEIEAARQTRLVVEGADDVVSEESLRGKIRRSLESARPLRIKMGIDPTSPDIHLGHMVVYRMIRRFQDLGHTAVLIIGDYTARIGDPTGRNSERPPLDAERVNENAERYCEQIFKVVDRERVEIRRQSEWFDGFDLQKTVNTLSRFSVAQLLAHETFRKRLDSGDRLSVHELLYPILQAYDSVEIAADVEFGGSDQRFNCLCGRDLQRQAGMEPQVVITMPLLAGTDGLKMSKSKGNHIAVLSTAAEKVGRVMSLPDAQLPDFITYASSWTGSVRESRLASLSAGSGNPRDLKLALALDIASIYHPREEAEAGVASFVSQFTNHELPSDIPEWFLPAGSLAIDRLMKEAGLAPSLAEARRLIVQGGVSVDGERVSDWSSVVRPGLVKVGKRRYLRVVEALR